MNKIKRFTVSFAALMLFSGVAMALPAAAEHSSPLSSNDATVADDTTAPNDSQSGNTLAQQFRQMAQLKIQEAKLNAKVHTEVERQQACNARKANLERRMGNAVTQAEKHKQVFDKIYSRVKDFYTTKNLNVSNYADLTAKVDTAAANAQASIDALKALDISVDCTSQTVANSVSAFQQAVSSTRDSLKAYRAALVDLINSLKGASTGASSDSSTNSTTNTGNH